MIAYRLTALQYGRVILEPSHPTRRLGVVETSVNVYDPAFTSYTEGSALTQPLQHLKKHMPQETIIELSSLIFSKYPGEVVDESYPGGRRQAMDDFTAWMIDDELAGGSMIEHSWTTLQFGPVAVVSTLRSTTTMAAHGNGLYMEWDNKIVRTTSRSEYAFRSVAHHSGTQPDWHRSSRTFEERTQAFGPRL